MEYSQSGTEVNQLICYWLSQKGIYEKGNCYDLLSLPQLFKDLSIYSIQVLTVYQ